MEILGLIGEEVGSGVGLKPLSLSKSGGSGCACGVAFWSFAPCWNCCGGLATTFGLGGMRMTGDLAATFFLGAGATGMGVRGIVVGAVATIGGVMG